MVENICLCTKHNDFQAFKSKNHRNSYVYELSMFKSPSITLKTQNKDSNFHPLDMAKNKRKRIRASMHRHENLNT